MSSFTLSPFETALLTAASARSDAQLTLPAAMKSTAVQHLLGKLRKHELVAATEHEGAVRHHLTPAGYQAVGLKPPSAVPAPALPAQSRTATPASDAPPQPGTKREHVLALLSRSEGASLAELITATGWLPHTTRAALSRLRSAGQTLEKSSREDGATAYRLIIEQPRPRRRSRKSAAEARAQVSIG